MVKKAFYQFLVFLLTSTEKVLSWIFSLFGFKLEYIMILDSKDGKMTFIAKTIVYDKENKVYTGKYLHAIEFIFNNIMSLSLKFITKVK